MLDVEAYKDLMKIYKRHGSASFDPADVKGNEFSIAMYRLENYCDRGLLIRRVIKPSTHHPLPRYFMELPLDTWRLLSHLDSERTQLHIGWVVAITVVCAVVLGLTSGH